MTTLAAHDDDRDRLPHLAAAIHREMQAAEDKWRDAVAHAVRAGELLLEAKAVVRHGQWLPWLDANFNGSQRTAQLYMRLARNSATVADLPSVREAVGALTPPREVTEATDTPGSDEWQARVDAEAREAGQRVAATSGSAHLGRAMQLLTRGEAISRAMVHHGREIAREVSHDPERDPEDVARMLELAALFVRVGTLRPWNDGYDDASDALQAALDRKWTDLAGNEPMEP